ncbi:MAG: hypothetical protein IPO43_15345 [Rhodoferax sp.]|nr:hypothetical protein [Rhodoferax sp.]
MAELHAQVGDSVKRGQLLASFAAESVQADVALARAAVAEAQANAAEAAANADRARAVQGSGAISAQQVNQYLTQEQTARHVWRPPRAQLDAQLLRLKNTQLLAPDSGVISAPHGHRWLGRGCWHRDVQTDPPEPSGVAWRGSPLPSWAASPPAPACWSPPPAAHK